MIDRLPFDKYELEPSPLTQYILERKSPNICLQVRYISIYHGDSITFLLILFRNFQFHY